ncbi:MAG: PadR family transcriptional regulator [Candidatus Binatia bacterium]|nr:PadR family transcriptional regulator [Candidatus Binatia bacterium]
MALKHVVLAVASEMRAHGYAIHSRLGEALPVARPCDSARIYGILAVLERAGWLGVSHEEAARGRMRKVYWPTALGLRSLRQWLHHPRPGGGLLRRSLCLHLAFTVDRARRNGKRIELRPWRRALERKARRRDLLLRSPGGEGTLARLLRLRELGHVEAELRVLRGVVEDGAPGEIRSVRRPRAPSSASR